MKVIEHYFQHNDIYLKVFLKSRLFKNRNGHDEVTFGEGEEREQDWTVISCISDFFFFNLAYSGRENKIFAPVNLHCVTFYTSLCISTLYSKKKKIKHCSKKFQTINTVLQCQNY